MHVIQAGRQRKGEVGADEGILGITSIHRISGEHRLIAQILHSVLTVPAITVYATHPGDANPRSERQLDCRTLDHLSDNLMARNELLFDLRQVSFNDVEVRTTDPAGNHPEQDVPGLKLWTGNFLHL